MFEVGESYRLATTTIFSRSNLIRLFSFFITEKILTWSSLQSRQVLHKPAYRAHSKMDSESEKMYFKPWRIVQRNAIHITYRTNLV